MKCGGAWRSAEERGGVVERGVGVELDGANKSVRSRLLLVTKGREVVRGKQRAFVRRCSRTCMRTRVHVRPVWSVFAC